MSAMQRWVLLCDAADGCDQTIERLLTLRDTRQEARDKHGWTLLRVGRGENSEWLDLCPQHGGEGR